MSQAGIANLGAIPPPPGSLTDLQGQDGVTVPPNGSGIIFVVGAVAAAGTTPFTTTGNAGTSTETWTIQRAQAAGASAANIVGLAAFNSAEFTVDANGFVSLAGGGLAVDSFAMQTGTSPVVPTGAGLVTFNGAVVANGTNPVRTDGTGANTMALEVQISAAIAATDATRIGLAAFDSARFTVDANGFVSLNGSGVGLTITGNTGGALPPTAGNWNIFGATVAAGTTPVATSGAGSTLTTNVQISQAIAATNATNIGLSAFNSANFSVDANGFVSLVPTGFLNKIGVDAATAPGTNPVVPNASSQINVTGGQVAAGTTTNVIRTNSLAANTYTIEIQRSQAVASSTIGSNGVSHFNSAQFAVDANGFVSIIAGGFIWNDVTGATQTIAVENGYVTDRGGGVTYTLPATANFGDEFIITGKSGAWTLAQNANQQINISASSTTVGVGGSLASTNAGDSIWAVCTTAGASTVWRVYNFVGNITVT